MSVESAPTKKWHDMTPLELYDLERHYEEVRCRAQAAINLLREHMQERKMDLRPIYYGF